VKGERGLHGQKQAFSSHNGSVETVVKLMSGSSRASCATGCGELGAGVTAWLAGQCPYPHGTQPPATPAKRADQVW